MVPGRPVPSVAVSGLGSFRAIRMGPVCGSTLKRRNPSRTFSIELVAIGPRKEGDPVGRLNLL